MFTFNYRFNSNSLKCHQTAPVLYSISVPIVDKDCANAKMLCGELLLLWVGEARVNRSFALVLADNVSYRGGK